MDEPITTASHAHATPDVALARPGLHRRSHVRSRVRCHRRLDHRRIRNLSLPRRPGRPGITYRRVLGEANRAVRDDHAGLPDRIELGPGHAANCRGLSGNSRTADWWSRHFGL